MYTFRNSRINYLNCTVNNDLREITKSSSPPSRHLRITYLLRMLDLNKAFDESYYENDNNSDIKLQSSSNHDIYN